MKLRWKVAGLFIYPIEMRWTLKTRVLPGLTGFRLCLLHVPLGGRKIPYLLLIPTTGRTLR